MTFSNVRRTRPMPVRYPGKRYAAIFSLSSKLRDLSAMMAHVKSPADLDRALARQVAPLAARANALARRAGLNEKGRR